MSHNILYIQSSIVPYNDGISRVTSLVAGELEEYGNNVYYAFYFRDNDEIPEDRKIKFDTFWTFQEFIENLHFFIEKNNINIIINQDQRWPGLIEYFKYIKATTTIKIIYCLHNTPIIRSEYSYGWRYELGQIKHKILHGYRKEAEEYRQMYDLCHKYILLSESFIKTARKYYGLKSCDKMISIANPAIPICIRHNEDFHLRKNQVVIVARIYERQKNIKSALRIWQKIESHNYDYNLVIVGDGDDRIELENYSQELGLKRIEFVGRQNNPEKYYSESKFFMITSRYEGFPMTLVEAMTHGCIPFVFNSFSAVHDIIKNQINGFLIKSEDEIAYAKKMLECMQNDRLLDPISHNCMSSVSKFDAKKIGKIWNDLINSI